MSQQPKATILAVEFSGRPKVFYYLAPPLEELPLGAGARIVVKNKESFAIPTVLQAIPYDSAPAEIQVQATEYIVTAISTEQHQSWQSEWEKALLSGAST